MPGPWYIVTGGNRGLGLEVARSLAQDGKSVIIASRDAKRGSGVAQILGRQVGDPDRVQALQLDVEKQESLQAFTQQINSKYSQQIYALINNAGVYPSGWDEHTFKSTKRINLEGPIELCQAIVPAMIDGGRIVNVTSSLGHLDGLNKSYRSSISSASSLDELLKIEFNGGSAGSSSFSPCYDVSKAMVNRATLLMSQLPEFKHVSVNAADPGWCSTEMGGKSATRSPLQGRDSILAVLDLPLEKTGGVYFDGQPSKI